MANLFFKFSSMDAGKSSSLLQVSHNYIQGGMNTLIMTPAIDDRFGVGKVTSRIGLQADAVSFSKAEDLNSLIEKYHISKPVDCVLIDESQFLSKEQVEQLALVVDFMNIPVLCYGLRTDFLGELFEGSRYLLAWADKIEEIKAICSTSGCGKKATMVLRKDSEGNVATSGSQISIGGNDSYQSVCRKHHTIALIHK